MNLKLLIKVINILALNFIISARCNYSVGSICNNKINYICTKKDLHSVCLPRKCLDLNDSKSISSVSVIRKDKIDFLYGSAESSSFKIQREHEISTEGKLFGRRKRLIYFFDKFISPNMSCETVNKSHIQIENFTTPIALFLHPSAVATPRLFYYDITSRLTKNYFYVTKNCRDKEEKNKVLTSTSSNVHENYNGTTVVNIRMETPRKSIASPVTIRYSLNPNSGKIIRNCYYENGIIDISNIIAEIFNASVCVGKNNSEYQENNTTLNIYSKSKKQLTVTEKTNKPLQKTKITSSLKIDPEKWINELFESLVVKTTIAEHASELEVTTRISTEVYNFTPNTDNGTSIITGNTTDINYIYNGHDTDTNVTSCNNRVKIVSEEKEPVRNYYSGLYNIIRNKYIDKKVKNITTEQAIPMPAKEDKNKTFSIQNNGNDLLIYKGKEYYNGSNIITNNNSKCENKTIKVYGYDSENNVYLTTETQNRLYSFGTGEQNYSNRTITYRLNTQISGANNYTTESIFMTNVNTETTRKLSKYKSLFRYDLLKNRFHDSNKKRNFLKNNHTMKNDNSTPINGLNRRIENYILQGHNASRNCSNETFVFVNTTKVRSDMIVCVNTTKVMSNDTIVCVNTTKVYAYNNNSGGFMMSRIDSTTIVSNINESVKNEDNFPNTNSNTSSNTDMTYFGAAGRLIKECLNRMCSMKKFTHCWGNVPEPTVENVTFYLFTRHNVYNPEKLSIDLDTAYYTEMNNECNEDDDEDNDEDDYSNDLDIKSKTFCGKTVKRSLNLNTAKKCSTPCPQKIKKGFKHLQSGKSLIVSKHFNVLNPTKIIIHGYTQDYQADEIINLKNAYLNKGCYNVILVDWAGLATAPCYNFASTNSRSVGYIVGELLRQLMISGVSAKTIHIVGFSLGAQVAGFAGNSFDAGNVARITGLDPAKLFFPLNEHDIGLDAGDAKFVDVIHTSILGNSLPLGHADFYPNGGVTQPGCDKSDISCSHSRGLLLFTESVRSSIGFKALPCDSWQSFVHGHCESRSVLMGDPCPVNTSGLFFLETNNTAPYAVAFKSKKAVPKRTNFFFGKSETEETTSSIVERTTRERNTTIN